MSTGGGWVNSSGRPIQCSVTQQKAKQTKTAYLYKQQHK